MAVGLPPLVDGVLEVVFVAAIEVRLVEVTLNARLVSLRVSCSFYVSFSLVPVPVHLALAL